MENLVEVGCIRDAYAIQGWIKVKPYTEDSVLLYEKNWWLRSKQTQQFSPLAIVNRKIRGEFLLAQTAEIAAREQALAYKGWTIWVDRKKFPVLNENEHYHADLLNLEVFNLNEQHLGTVVAILESGAHPILQLSYPTVCGTKNQQRLIPFVKTFVHDIDFAQKKMYCDWFLGDEEFF